MCFILDNGLEKITDKSCRNFGGQIIAQKKRANDEKSNFSFAHGLSSGSVGDKIPHFSNAERKCYDSENENRAEGIADDFAFHVIRIKFAPSALCRDDS